MGKSQKGWDMRAKTFSFLSAKDSTICMEHICYMLFMWGGGGGGGGGVGKRNKTSN